MEITGLRRTGCMSGVDNADKGEADKERQTRRDRQRWHHTDTCIHT